MKIKLCPLFIFASFFFFSFFGGTQRGQSQNPLVKQWDYRYGGTADDFISLMDQTHDGGYILGGYSVSGTGADKTQASWGIDDFWIVKTDAAGIKQWDKNFGGTGDEQLYSIEQTKDNGYIIGGYTGSGISGDVTQPAYGYNDFWIVKTDSLGTKLWDKRYGGTLDNQLFCVRQTSDGGYILGGWSDSGIGGSKSQPTRGLADFWIVKTDSLGNQQWDKRFGGADDDRLSSLVQTADGGYLLAGSSSSGIGGDKTEPQWGDSWADYWIVKIDSAGTKQWDKRYGGYNQDYLKTMKATSDGGYILLGHSFSGIGGDKTQPAFGQNDYWLVKIDSLGIVQWDKVYGGSDMEDLVGNVEQTADAGFLLSGTSYSPLSGNKTENNLGIEQAWVVKTDDAGNVKWDKTVFTNGHDEMGYAIQTADGCYAIANCGDAGAGGYRTQGNRGASDYWIVKFCDTTAVAVALFTAPNHLCPGTCIDFTNLSQNTSACQWNFPGASPATSTDINPQNICYGTPGSYAVTLIASNANGSDTVTLNNFIIVYPYPAPQGIQQSDDSLFANTGATAYQWYLNGNIIMGATDYFYVAPVSGDYNVVATDANGCEVEAAVFNVIASVQSMNNSFPIVEPNPFSSHLTIHFPLSPNSIAFLKIFNSIGEVVLEKELKLEEYTLNLSALPQGIYLMSVLNEGRVYNQKIVK